MVVKLMYIAGKERVRASAMLDWTMLTAKWSRTYSVGRVGIALSIYRAVFRPTGEEFKSDSVL